MLPQIVRLILLTVFIVGSYLIAKRSMTPASFGEYGWYRGDSLREQAAFEPRFTGQDSCTECHEEVAEENASYEHSRVSCDACHGSQPAHVEDETIDVPPRNDEDCLLCHELAPGRPEWVGLVVLADHYKEDGKTCVECHMPHQPNEIPYVDDFDF